MHGRSREEKGRQDTCDQGLLSRELESTNDGVEKNTHIITDALPMPRCHPPPHTHLNLDTAAIPSTTATTTTTTTTNLKAWHTKTKQNKKRCLLMMLLILQPGMYVVYIHTLPFPRPTVQQKAYRTKKQNKTCTSNTNSSFNKDDSPLPLSNFSVTSPWEGEGGGYSLSYRPYTTAAVKSGEGYHDK